MILKSNDESSLATQSFNLIGRKIFKPLFFILLVLLHSNCSQIEQSSEVIPVDNVKFHKLSTSKLLVNTEIVQLEVREDCLIGSEFKIMDAEEEYLILDRSTSNKVFRFNSEGWFINDIGQIGKGRGEYIQVYDALYANSKIQILSGFPNTEIYKYDLSGEFLSKKTVFSNQVCYSFHIDPKQKCYFFYSPISNRRIIKANMSDFLKQDSMLPVVEGSNLRCLAG